MSEPPRGRLKARTHRLIASRFPPVGVFDDIASTEDDLRAAFELEQLTSARTQSIERLRRIPQGGVASGPGATMIMAAFLYPSPGGARFSDERLGAWYAATELETAFAETVHHHERRLRASAGGFPNRMQMRELVSDVDEELLDLRGMKAERPDLYDPDDYAASQAFAVSRRWPSGPESGVAYDSVRREGGTNVCIWSPMKVGAPVVQADHFEYVWNGKGELTILRLSRAR